jgi:rare lipoprotein A
LPHPIAKLGALAGAVALMLPAAASAAGPGGGMLYDDAGAPTVTSDGSRLAAPLGGLLGGTLRFDGRLTGTEPGDTVTLERLDETDGWVVAATALVGPDGGFRATWRADRAGRTTVRVVRGGQSATAQAATALPTRPVTVYRPAVATWYGPGFFGRRTACGRKLTRNLLGVAHRRLPCGTLVEVFHEGRSVTVPVVDRGPFRRGTTWDLTAAAARALGITETTTVGTVRVAPGRSGRARLPTARLSRAAARPSGR